MKLRYLLLLPVLFVTSFLASSPVAICIDQVYTLLPVDACEVTLYGTDIDAGSYDTRGASISLTLNGGEDLGPGTYNLTMTVTSRYGSSSCWTQVNIRDYVVPTVTCHDQTHYLVAPDQPIIYNIDDMVTITDNCEPLSYISISVHDDSRFGSSSFSASATDDGGNTGSCSGTVTTIDAEPQNYCSSSRNDYYEHISNVQVGAISHSSGADGGYDWNYPADNSTLYHGSTYTMSYTPGFRFSTTYHEYWSVYIDKNADGDFTDSGELLHQWHGYGGNSFSFTSPGTVWGWSRIRVVMKYGSYATSPCGGGGYGETEDISVYLRPFFWFPWPGFRQQEQISEQHAVADQEVMLGSDRPVEEAFPGEMAQRRQLIEPESAIAPNTPLAAAPIKVFPNPAKAGQAISITGQDIDQAFSLLNMAGQVIKTYAPGTSQVHLPSHLPSGIYLLSGVASGNSQPWTRRVVIK